MMVGGHSNTYWAFSGSATFKVCISFWKRTEDNRRQIHVVVSQLQQHWVGL